MQVILGIVFVAHHDTPFRSNVSSVSSIEFTLMEPHPFKYDMDAIVT